MQLSFSPNIFTDPSMRPHLEKYYQQQYTPMHERIAAMQEAEANGQGPKTIQTHNGQTAVELSAAQYEAIIPSFDKWLDMQENIMADLNASTKIDMERARQRVEYLENHTPEGPSNVRAVFANGNQILGYINSDGGVVSHDGAHVLQNITKQADALNLHGQARIDYILDKGKAALSGKYSQFNITEYSQDNMPSKRAFAEKWYPHHDVDASYNESLTAAYKALDQAEEQYQQMVENRAEMMRFLIQSIQEESA